MKSNVDVYVIKTGMLYHCAQMGATFKDTGKSVSVHHDEMVFCHGGQNVIRFDYTDVKTKVEALSELLKCLRQGVKPQKGKF